MKNKIKKIKSESGIYCILCTTNNKRYIGQSRNIKTRISSHKSDLRKLKHHNSSLQEAYNIYGEDAFVWEAVEYCDIEKLDKREKYWIKKFDSFNNGFNRTDGGKDNFKTDEHVVNERAKVLQTTWDNDQKRHEKASERMQGENNPMYGRTGNLNPAYGKDHSGEKNGMYGKHHTESSNELNKQAHLGKNNKQSKPVICIETNELFYSMGEAGREKRCNDTSINKVCRGVKKTAGGYHWRYATYEEIEKHKNTHID